MTLSAYMTHQTKRIEAELERLLPPSHECPEMLHEAMRYSVLGGGKRLRAILALAACETVGGDSGNALGYAAALEMIHAYSLIHDDLPCMDDDDVRRGKPTNHKVFGEAIAVLSGDALHTYGMETIAKLPLDGGCPPSVALALLQAVTEACGSRGIIGGQAVDTLSEGQPITAQRLEYIHRCKTGALITVAVQGGALLGGASEAALEALVSYGRNFGLAFQITDDILDVVGDQSKLGKTVGVDSQKGKSTYPALYGLATAKERASHCVHLCRTSLEVFGEKGQILRELAQFVLDRDH